MRKMSFVLFIVFLMNMVSFGIVKADVTAQFSLNEDTLTVSGNGENVNIFLLNPGKTVEDLNNIKSATEYQSVVNYFTVINLGIKKDYTISFDINNYDKDETYLLYIKDSDGESSINVKTYEEDVKIYVSPDGNAIDGNTTFKTIEAAKNYVRMLDKNLNIEVIIKGGTYSISKGMSFKAEDSGTKEHPVTYKAAEGEEVILTGSTAIDITKAKKVNNTSILNRVSPDVAGKLMEIDLAEQGIPQEVVNYLKNHMNGYNAKPMGVFLNGKRQDIARWPNSGYETIRSVTNGDGSATIKINNANDRIAKWSTAKDLYVEGYFGYEWCSEWSKIATVNASTSTLTFQNPARYGVNSGGRIAVINLLEEIDIPGEWYADAETMKMYYYPPYELTEQDSLEIATLCENFIATDNAEYLNFEGITFKQNANSPEYFEQSYSIGNGVVLVGSSDINFTNCNFIEIGMNGMWIHTSDNIKIDRCNFYNTGYSNIKIENCGDIKTLDKSDIVVSNSYLSKTARDSGMNDCAGISIVKSCGVVVESNILRDMKNSAIRYTGLEHTIRDNEIYNCVNETSDAGAIYAGRSWVDYGTKIENNYFHTIGIGLDAHQACAVFWDDFHSGNTFTGNIVDMKNQSYTAGVKIGGGRDNIITNNIFMNASDGVNCEYRSVSYNDELYNGELYKSFLKAANDNVTNAKNITDSDWLTVYKTNYPSIMTNYKNVTSDRRYKGENTVTNNTLYNADVNVDFLMMGYITNNNNKSSNTMPDLSGLAQIGIKGEIVLNDSMKSFDLQYPHNNDSINVNTTLNWEKSIFADKYTYEVSEEPTFATKVLSGETRYNSIDVVLPKANTKYYWRVNAINISNQLGETVVCNEVFSFTTDGDVVIEKAYYDETTNEVVCQLSNTKSTLENISLIVANKKGNQMTLAKLLNDGIAAGAKKVEYRIEFPSGAEETLELYLWNGVNEVKPITIKRVID